MTVIERYVKNQTVGANGFLLKVLVFNYLKQW